MFSLPMVALVRTSTCPRRSQPSRERAQNLPLSEIAPSFLAMHAGNDACWLCGATPIGIPRHPRVPQFLTHIPWWAPPNPMPGWLWCLWWVAVAMVPHPILGTRVRSARSATCFQHVLLFVPEAVSEEYGLGQYFLRGLSRKMQPMAAGPEELCSPCELCSCGEWCQAQEDTPMERTGEKVRRSSSY